MYATPNQQTSFFRVLLMLCAVIGAGLTTLGVTQDRNVVEKVSTTLVMPSGLLCMLLLTLSIQLWTQKKQNHTSELRIGLLTSAWHLPRAMRLANHNGLKPLPLPADFRTGANVEGFTTGQIVESMIPNGFALEATCLFAKEYLGMLVGR